MGRAHFAVDCLAVGIFRDVYKRQVVIRIVELDGRRFHGSRAAAARPDRRNNQNRNDKRELCPVLMVQLSPFVNRAEDESDCRWSLTLLHWHGCRRGRARLIFIRDQFAERAGDVSS